ncbi:MAG TPA: BsuPI-related putative proteinase inhibitor [Gemmatimonadaceae bacterium]
MSSRFLIPVLCIGAVVYACGPRSRGDASGARQDAASLAQTVSRPVAPRAESRATSRKSADQKAMVSAHLTVSTDPSAVRLALHVVNMSNRRVEVNFPSGQTYDFVIVDSIGREVWHWGSGRMFTQTLRNKLLDGGESMELRETWKTESLAPGRYTARGVLKSENYPLTQTTEFVVAGATTVASKEEP